MSFIKILPCIRTLAGTPNEVGRRSASLRGYLDLFPTCNKEADAAVDARLIQFSDDLKHPLIQSVIQYRLIPADAPQVLLLPAVQAVYFFFRNGAHSVYFTLNTRLVMLCIFILTILVIFYFSKSTGYIVVGLPVLFTLPM